MSILLGATGDVRGEEYCLLVLLSHTSNTTIIHLPSPPSSSLYSTVNATPIQSRSIRYRHMVTPWQGIPHLAKAQVCIGCDAVIL